MTLFSDNALGAPSEHSIASGIPSTPVFLTMHKAASSYVGSILQEVFARNQYQTEDLASEAFVAGMDEIAYIKQNISRLQRPKTYFGPFRTKSVTPLLELKALRPIVHVRDPRDCIVSLYYSLVYSHVEPGPGPVRDQFLKDRQQFRDMGVDAFCFEALRRGYSALGIMRKAVQELPGATLSRYEDMVADFGTWLRKLLSDINLDVDTELFSSLQRNAVFEVSEDPLQHKRQVTPGDHKRKLRLETQQAMTEAFVDDLLFFGYSL